MKTVLQFLFFLVISFSAKGQEQFSIYFESNKFDLTPKEKSNLENWVTQNTKVKIVGIYGFCDEDGSTGYNDTLAKNRINSIYNLIKNKVKIRDDFKTRSFGELHNLTKIKAQNRKVTLYFLEEKDIVRENEILGIKETVVIPEPKLEIVYPEKLSFENPDGSKSEFKLNREFMKKIQDATVGEKLKIENLNFKINTYIVVPESKGKMYELLLVLQNNPKLKIEIQGHLCCMPIDRLDLSTQRAKAINNFFGS